jgi:hypothetical protein
LLIPWDAEGVIYWAWGLGVASRWVDLETEAERVCAQCYLCDMVSFDNSRFEGLCGEGNVLIGYRTLTYIFEDVERAVGFLPVSCLMFLLWDLIDELLRRYMIVC